MTENWASAQIDAHNRSYRDGRRDALAEEAARLSKLLFEAREGLEMWADSVEARLGGTPHYARDLVRQIDAYRAERGWNPHGFGGESSPSRSTHKEFRYGD